MLRDGSAIRLTVARYYTPLGRSIQRPYEKGKKVYMDEVMERFQSDSTSTTETNKQHKGKKFLSGCGDSLFAGGGITPTILIPHQKNGNLPHAGLLIGSISEFSNYAFQFYRKNSSAINKLNDATELLNNKMLRDMIWQGWIKHNANDSVNYAIATPDEIKLITERLMASIARYKWRNDGFYKIINANDPYLQKATTQLNP
jgi:carboxyl-terminal processing protease